MMFLSAKRVILLTKPNCHLCEDAEEVVAQICSDLDIMWEKISILSDIKLARLYGEKIPVLLVDGNLHSFWYVDGNLLRESLS